MTFRHRLFYGIRGIKQPHNESPHELRKKYQPKILYNTLIISVFRVTALCSQGRSTNLKLEDLCDKLANSQSFLPSIRLHSLGGISVCDSSECEEFDVGSFHWRLYCVVAVIALIVNCARLRRPFIYQEFASICCDSCCGF